MAQVGVDTEVFGTGRCVIGMNEQLLLFPLFKQNYTWTASLENYKRYESITFQTDEGIRLPDNVVKALNSTIEVTQRAKQHENELRESEAKKNVAKMQILSLPNR